MEKNIIVYNNIAGTANKIKNLCKETNIRVLVAKTKEELLLKLITSDAQLLILDFVYNKEELSDVVKLISVIRSKSRIPVLVVSEKATEEEQIKAFAAGADDFVSASCSPLELQARINTQIRRYVELVNICDTIDDIHEIDELIIDDSQKKVTVMGKEVHLTPIEYKILFLLVKEKGKILSISQIYEAIWNLKAVGAENIIAVHIRHIREKIEIDPKNPKYLQLVWGTGYKVG